jgi:MFS transporter, NNP family, nitrate/nitrite transporter
VGGWGNLGAGVTNLVIGMILYPLFQVFFDGDREKAWRSMCIVPAFFAFVTGVVVYNVGDDCPKGNYAELKQRGAFPEVTAMVSFKAAMLNMNSWLLFIQYACCFGVELTMNTAATGYFKDEFDLTPESAAAVGKNVVLVNL